MILSITELEQTRIFRCAIRDRIADLLMSCIRGSQGLSDPSQQSLECCSVIVASYFSIKQLEMLQTFIDVAVFVVQRILDFVVT